MSVCYGKAELDAAGQALLALIPQGYPGVLLRSESRGIDGRPTGRAFARDPEVGGVRPVRHDADEVASFATV